MQKPTLILLVAALIAALAGAFYLTQMAGEPDAPVVQWTAAEEVDGSQEDLESPAGETADFERTEAEPVAAAPVANDEPRVAAILRGRVVDKFQQPVANARVWLEISASRRGRTRGVRPPRPRRIPEPVLTNSDGLFAFQGEAFRNLRVALQVKHDQHAIGLFDRDLGDVQANAAGGEVELELGDLVLMSGGVVRGRVTDLDGNAIANAEVTLEPAMRNRLRWQRNRDELLSPVVTDGNGFYQHSNVPAGDFTVSVLASMHTVGRSDDFTVAEDEVVEVPDVQLGPGFEVTGYVRDQQGEPIANASVRLRNSLSNRNRDSGSGPRRAATGRGGSGRGRGGRSGFGRDHRTQTDEQGRFFLEHLPGALLELRVSAKGFLDFEQDEIDPRSGQPIHVAMLDALRITGVVTAPDGAPIDHYAVRAVRVRGLPDPNAPALDLNDLMQKMRNPNLSEEERGQLMRQMRNLRDQFTGGGDRLGRGGDRSRGRRGGRGSLTGLGEMEAHKGGRFVIDGLQEGVYEVHVQALDFARHKATEVIVQRDAAPPDLRIVLDPGVYVAGAVFDDRGNPVAGARIQLRSAALEQPRTARSNGDNGSRGFDLNRMARAWARSANGTALRLETQTDDDGLFIIKHVQRGVFELSATADGFSERRTDPFELSADRSDFELRLEPLGSLVGVVTGFDPDELAETRVGAVRLSEDGNIDFRGMFGGRGGRGGGRGFRSVTIEQDGSYRIDDLLPGNYVVRSWVGSPQQLMRELGPDLMGGKIAADVAVRGGDESRWDLQLTRPQVGGIRGTVTHNGENAAGFRVELRQQDGGTSATSGPFGPGGRGGRGGRMAGFFGGRHQATVQASGQFRITDVPAGTYTLRITAARSRTALVEEPITIFADTLTERSFSLQTGSLRGTLTVDDGSDTKALGGRISLLPNQSAVPEDLNRWLRENPSFDARVRNGTFEFSAVPPGSYLLVAQVRGRPVTSLPVTITGTEQVTVPVAKASPQNGSAPK